MRALLWTLKYCCWSCILAIMSLAIWLYVITTYRFVHVHVTWCTVFTIMLTWHFGGHGPLGPLNPPLSHWPIPKTAVCTAVCMKAKGRHFEHLLWSSRTTGSSRSHSHYWEEVNITLRFLCNIKQCRHMTKVRRHIMYAFNRYGH